MKSSINFKKSKLYRYSFDKDILPELTRNENISEFKILFNVLFVIGKHGPITSTKIANSCGSKYSYEILKKLKPMESEFMPVFNLTELDSNMTPQKKYELYKILDNLFNLRWISNENNSDQVVNMKMSLSENKRFLTISYGSRNRLTLDVDKQGNAKLKIFRDEKEVRNYNLILRRRGKIRQLYTAVAYNPLLKERTFIDVSSKNNKNYYELNLRGFLLLLGLAEKKTSKGKKLDLYRKEIEEVLINLESSSKMFFLKNWSDFGKFNFEVVRTLEEIAGNLYKLALDINITEYHLLYIVTIQYLSKLKQYFYWVNLSMPDVYYTYRDLILRKLMEFHGHEYNKILKEIEAPSRIYRMYESIK
jgi:hypothetical protein